MQRQDEVGATSRAKLWTGRVIFRIGALQCVLLLIHCCVCCHSER
jgi:hypothetical protein